MAVKRKKFEVPEQKDNGVRINKYLGDAGVCSRREADRFIEQGKVTIDGVVAEMGSRVFPGQKVTFNGKELKKQEEQVLIAFYKPVGIVCTTDTREPDNVIDFLNYGKRIYPIGRLDKDSEGLLLLTNDGDIVNKILRAGNHHEKEYLVTVNKPLTPDFLKGMAGGVPILDTVTKPCVIEQTGKCSFKIILTQGLNRQIRRMCEYFDYRVLALKRVRIMHIQLGHLKPGTYRNLSEGELERLQTVLKNSSGLPAAVEKQLKREAAEQMKPLEVSLEKNVAQKGVSKNNVRQGVRTMENRKNNTQQNGKNVEHRSRTGAGNGKADRTKKENRGTGRTAK